MLFNDCALERISFRPSNINAYSHKLFHLAIGALFALKRKLMLEKELAKIDGQMTLLIQ
jgi:hypothetical protein